MRCGTACEVASRPLTRAASRDDAVLPVRGLARSWARGVVDPVAVMRALPDVGWPKTGLVAVVTRFTVQDLVQTLPLALLGRRPFIPAKRLWLITTILGWGDLRDDAAVRGFIGTHPFVAFRPAASPA